MAKGSGSRLLGGALAVVVLGSGGTATHAAVTHPGRHVGSRPQARPVPHAAGNVPAVLTVRQIVGYARGAGFTGRDLQIACAVALAESGGHPREKYHNTDSHRSTDLGLWQINDYWNSRELRGGDWADPADNARMAFHAWRRAGWRDWVTYQHGRHLQFMDRCGRAAA